MALMSEHMALLGDMVLEFLTLDMLRDAPLACRPASVRYQWSHFFFCTCRVVPTFLLSVLTLLTGITACDCLLERRAWNRAARY